MERVIPRQYKALDLSNPIDMAFSLAISLMGYEHNFGVSGNIINRLTEKYSYGPGVPPSANGFTEAPFDFLADQLRGFKEISMDVRRMPDKVAEACDALYPISKKACLQSQWSIPQSFYLYICLPLCVKKTLPGYGGQVSSE
ncbi:MAG: hypothetical protein GX434_16780 [Peptococcaceae bacterium]|nr:hypothetical protein [Peptococcaceae bacterium]